jgi:hypothetical protein
LPASSASRGGGCAGTAVHDTVIVLPNLGSGRLSAGIPKFESGVNFSAGSQQLGMRHRAGAPLAGTAASAARGQLHKGRGITDFMMRQFGPLVGFGHLGYRRTGDVPGYAAYRNPA